MALLACFGAGAALTGGNSPGTTSPGTTSPALAGGGGAARRPMPAVAGATLGPVMPTSTFSASGQGPGSTEAFRPDGPWALGYTVSCPGPGLATASLSVVHGISTLAGLDTSVAGTASGTRSGLTPAAVSVAVTVPSACTWSVTATVTAASTSPVGPSGAPGAGTRP